jgi:arylsulfatase A-like enzyme
VLSLDGTRHDYPDREPLPAFERLAREGVRAERLIPVFPANTFPNHVALATGTHPDRHGIVGNRFTDAVRGGFNYSADPSWIDAEPLWIAAERQGVRAAVFFWVGSEAAWGGRAATYRRAPFDSAVPEGVKVDQILEWARLPAAQRPGLIMCWWHGADRPGHQRGPDAPEVRAALGGQDAELGRLLRGLDELGGWAYTTLIVASDHGMTRVTRDVDVLEPLRRAGVRARADLEGGVAYIHLEQPAQRERALEALAALDGITAHPSEALPPELRLGRAGRVGDVVALIEPPRRFARGTAGGAWRRWFGSRRGGHGYRGELPDMGGIFFALGRGAPPGARLGAVRAIDLAPSVARLLGIDPPLQSEGRAVLPLDEGTTAPTRIAPAQVLR